MKKILFAFSFLLATSPLLAQVAAFNEVSRLESLCKVWGFLKYYHPKVATGELDWDKELILKVPQVKAAKTKEELSQIYIDWISNLGIVKSCKRCNRKYADSMKYNLNIGWISDKNFFTDELITRLSYIRDNRNQKSNFYVYRFEWAAPDFSREKSYNEMDFPNEEYRLVALFRYWNIINYYFPYKYVIGKDWNIVLNEMIPKFILAKDKFEYTAACSELTSSVNDSHAAYQAKDGFFFWGTYSVPFRYKIIGNKAIVTERIIDSLCKENDIMLGDVILKINGRELKEEIAEKGKYIGASNEPTRMRNLSRLLLRGHCDSILITFERNGDIITKTVKRYYNTTPLKLKEIDMPVYKELSNGIGYVNTGKLKIGQVDSIMAKMKNMKAIIIDVRNYPAGTMFALAEHLCKDKLPFAKFTKPDPTFPGMFRWVPAYKCGKKNNTEYYKGKVILLFDETTQSHAEFTCMALQTAPDVTCIGSQTAGADGNVTTIPFPGGGKAWMTGLGIYYPDGRKTQRVGIKPDIVITPTIEGIRKGKDEILDRAIQYIETGK
ncbi:MAG: S41 family peptidase [Bacteroidota bacterium]